MIVFTAGKLCLVTSSAIQHVDKGVFLYPEKICAWATVLSVVCQPLDLGRYTVNNG